MSQFDSILRMYAQSGFRTAEDWIARGRRVDGGAIPRVDATHHGIATALFSHDQTHMHRKTAIPGA